MSVDEDTDVGVTHRDGKKLRRRQRYCFCVGCVAVIVALGLAAVVLWVAVSETVLSSESSHGGGLECTPNENMRFNCIPEGGKSDTKEVCEKRGCCWADSSSKRGAPHCFYPVGFGYKVVGQSKKTSTGETLNITRKSGQPSQYGGDIDTVRVDVFYETPYRLRVKVQCLATEPLFSAQLQSPSLLLSRCLSRARDSVH